MIVPVLRDRVRWQGVSAGLRIAPGALRWMDEYGLDDHHITVGIPAAAAVLPWWRSAKKGGAEGDDRILAKPCVVVLINLDRPILGPEGFFDGAAVSTARLASRSAARAASTHTAGGSPSPHDPNQIAAAARAGCTSVAAVGEALQAGTNCGSCRAEIKGLIDACRLEAAAE